MAETGGDSKDGATPAADKGADPAGANAREQKASLLPWLDKYLDSDACWAMVAFALLIVAGIIVLWKIPNCYSDPPDDGFSRATTILLMLWVAWLYAWVIHCFAGDPYENRTRAIKFAYFFVILSFVAVSIMIANIGRASSFGVVEGCIASTDDSSFLPIRCDHPLRLPQPQTYPATPTPPPKGQAQGAVAAGTVTAADTAAVGVVKVPTFKDRMDNAAANHNYHHLLNIGGRLDRIGFYFDELLLSGCPAQMIHGGVPVPVYFILLALIGAAISLARNVPVIQRRSEDAYVGTVAEPRLAPGQVRELLAFQILQFVSAPFLAVAAYHTLKPESLATTVALGFLTGFASERILSLVSGRFKDINEKNETNTVLAGSIHGEVKRGGKPEVGATVEIDGVEKLKPVKTDAGGGFKLMGVPVSAAPYRLVARVTNTEGSFSGTATVTVDKPEEKPARTIDLVKT